MEVQVFKTEHELSAYTTSTGKFFPKENAYAGGLLRDLLWHILQPLRLLLPLQLVLDSILAGKGVGRSSTR